MDYKSAELCFRIMYGGAELVHHSAFTWMCEYFKAKNCGSSDLLCIIDSIENWIKSTEKEGNTLILTDPEAIGFV
jgi:hypothetical protein